MAQHTTLSALFFLLFFNVLLRAAQYDKYGLWVEGSIKQEIIFELVDDEEFIKEIEPNDGLFLPFERLKNYLSFVSYVRKNVKQQYNLPRIKSFFRTSILKDYCAFVLDDVSKAYEGASKEIGFIMNFKTNKINIYRTFESDLESCEGTIIPAYRMKVINDIITSEKIFIKDSQEAINLSVYFVCLLVLSDKIIVSNEKANKEINGCYLVSLTINDSERIDLKINRNGLFYFISRQNISEK